MAFSSAVGGPLREPSDQISAAEGMMPKYTGTSTLSTKALTYPAFSSRSLWLGVSTRLDEGVLLGKIDPVVLLLAGDPLAPGLESTQKSRPHDLIVT